MPKPTPPTGRAPAGGSLIVSGYGLRVTVERGHLRVVNGDGQETLRYARGTRSVRRLIVHGSAGTITLAALRWLMDTGAELVVLDLDGTVLVTSAFAGADHPVLRRAQSLLCDVSAGADIYRDLVRRKLAGQMAVLRAFGERTVADNVEAYSALITDHLGGGEVMQVEALAGGIYWDAWSCYPVRFKVGDRPSLPEHWLTFGNRHSPVSHSPRAAASPASSLTNFLYGVLVAEMRIALHAAGLDPGIGLLHVDLERRASLALDLVEPVRPRADMILLTMLRSRVFVRTDFEELASGEVRCTAEVRRLLTGYALGLRRLCAVEIHRYVTHLRTVPVPRPGSARIEVRRVSRRVRR